mmetsp:Transcript_41409/g.66527  ORF Transcript_41409/g.66527 Transcript_41409/m.66527 type:complete len:190 (+) Transcript_41409:422-991(+)
MNSQQWDATVDLLEEALYTQHQIPLTCADPVDRENYKQCVSAGLESPRRSSWTPQEDYPHFHTADFDLVLDTVLLDQNTQTLKKYSSPRRNKVIGTGPRIFQRRMTVKKATMIQNRLALIRQTYATKQRAVGKYTAVQRAQLLEKYRAKRIQKWRQQQQMKSVIRSKISEKRPRVRGRFVKTAHTIVAC